MEIAKILPEHALITIYKAFMRLCFESGFIFLMKLATKHFMRNLNLF